MKSPRIPAPVLWIWNHTAAFVALVLIALAFIVGIRLGTTPDPTASPPSHAHENAGSVSDSGDMTSDSTPQMYTCSMHPSVRLPDPDAKCPICFMELIPVRDNDTGDPNTLVLSESETVSARVQTTRVSRYVPTSTIRLFGKVRMDETTVERISAYFPGRIETLYANFLGSRVNQGDHLAEMYSPELLTAFEELRQTAHAAERSSSMSEIVRESSVETLNASRDRLRLFGIDPDLIERIENDGYDEDTFSIDAPRGGTITHIASQEGAYVQTGDPILTIADLTHLWIDLQAYESQISKIHWGQRVGFSVESHPGELFEGRVSFIDPMIDPSTRTAAVRVAFENPRRILKPGMFASATISVPLDGNHRSIAPEIQGRWVCPMHPTEIHDDQGTCTICEMDLVPVESLIEQSQEHAQSTPPLVVPSSAVLFTGTRSVVYTQTDDENGFRYTPVEVTLGQRADDAYIVLDGLKEHDRVVTQGAFRIDSAMQIASKPSMMSMKSESNDTTVTATSLPSTFKTGVTDSVNAYLDAQEALADDDLDAFNTHAQQLISVLDSIATDGLLGEDLSIWRRASRDLRPNAPYDDIERARADFEPMSNAVFTLIDQFGTPEDAAVHVAYCPMAFDFEGADWLQRTTTIDNPYFGSSMLQCGEILRTITSTHNHGGD
ncbi:MAG: efflux RND transporter periplasmic adaptor subunit [Phycisphaerales bacterium]|nr:efflux RND transporter periplasmic adaptor subunit [Phycisphaerales bacterium]